MWGAASNGTSNVEVFAYGQMPPGYVKLMGQADTALTLIPGCYEVTTSGSGRTFFEVMADGRIVERESRF